MSIALDPGGAQLGKAHSGPRPVVPAAVRDHVLDVALVAVVGVGAALRLWALGLQKLNYDESFTAMAGRLPIGRLVTFLTAHDSHPPLDYLLRAPLSRAGVSEFWLRFPSALCSIGALVLLAIWLRPRGRVAVVATGLLAVSAFQIAHGRDARMYAELEPLGIGIAMLTDRWLRAPARHHAPLLAGLVLAGLSTHVSMFLLAAGLFTAAGARRDRDAWRWRAAIVGAVGVWAVSWGPHFLVQSRGGHSSWIPPTSIETLTTAIARSVTFETAWTFAVLAAILAGAVVIVRSDRTLARVWVACFAVPIAIAAIAGLAEPVVLDRTFTLMAWAPVVAIAFLIERVLRRQHLVGVAAVTITAFVVVPGATWSLTSRRGPSDPLTALDRRIRPGDIVAVRPASKAPEMQWSLAIRNGLAGRPVEVSGLPKTYALRLGTGPATGRTWYLDWRTHRWPMPAAATSCGPGWVGGNVRARCLTDLRATP